MSVNAAGGDELANFKIYDKSSNKILTDTELKDVSISSGATVGSFASPIVINGIELEPDPLTYEIEGNSVTITDCDKIYEVDLVIPSSYQGKPVTKIGNNAFSSCRRTSRCRIRLETQVVGGTR